MVGVYRVQINAKYQAILSRSQVLDFKSRKEAEIFFLFD